MTTTTNTKKSTSSGAFKQIAKNDISAPTNFRHVVCGYDDFNQSRLNSSTSNPSPSTSSQATTVGLPNIQQQTSTTTKSSSLSSSSSSSSSILHSPNSPNNSGLHQDGSNVLVAGGAVNNTLRPDSVLYNSKSIYFY